MTEKTRWTLMSLTILALGLLCLLIAGCGTWRIELVQIQPQAVQTWQAEVSSRINDHEHRIAALEAAQPK